MTTDTITAATALTTILDVVDHVVAWLDAGTEPDDSEVTLRLLKISEEIGEAAEAWIGATGQNPRKGITHTRTDVADELADVVFAALVAMVSLGEDPTERLGEKAHQLMTRVNRRSSI